MAARKKGLSLEEKRTKMLELFYESKEVYQMKELEKVAPKQKGVISQSVKEITQMLVDDGLVECEKIGTFVCYWAFPSKALVSRKRKFDSNVQKLEEMKERICEAHRDLCAAQEGKEETEERRMLVARCSELKKIKIQVLEHVVELAPFDPRYVHEMSSKIAILKQDANRWTDNVFAIKKWCKNKFSMDEKSLNKAYEIPEDLDYI